MISKLTGLLDSSSVDSLVIDVGGVGYLVFVSGKTVSQLPPSGQPLSLMIETLVRNEQTQLFGFTQEADRSWFRLLLNIQGVGAKVALAILTVLTPDELHRAILAQDRTAITRAEGVGPKLAGRIVAELKDKVGGIEWGNAFAASSPRAMEGVTVLASGMSEAISALVNLGYRRAEAVEAVARSGHTLGASASTEALIRHGLNLISRTYAKKTVGESAGNG